MTIPPASTRTGTASTYTIGIWARICARRSGDSHEVSVSVSMSLTGRHHPRSGSDATDDARPARLFGTVAAWTWVT